MEFVATCAAGLEALLADELRSVTHERIRALRGQVSWSGQLRGALAACLWSRIASRVTLVLARGKAGTSDELYELAHGVPWEDHVPVGATIAVSASGTNEGLRSTRFVAQRTKDAVSDALLARAGFRPVIDLGRPDLRVIVRIGRGNTSLGIDLAGEPLFRRGYLSHHDRGVGLTTLRADYAAALLRAARWCADGHANSEGLLALYPGAGNLLAEAAGMASDHAPGLLRATWGHGRWLGGDSRLWDELCEEADERAREGRSRQLELHGCDTRRGAESATRSLLRSAGVRQKATFVPANELVRSGISSATVVADLSWFDEGDVVAESSAAIALAHSVGLVAHDDAGAPNANEPCRSPIAVLSKTNLAALVFGCQPTSVTRTLVGRDEARLSTYAPNDIRALGSVDVGNDSVPLLVGTSDQFATRLAKSFRLRRRWARRKDVSCYRLYDADLPDYRLSIDLFEGSQTPGRWLQVSEYAAPREIDAALAHARLVDAVAIAMATLDVRPNDVQVRVRSRSKGGSQYAKEAQERLAGKAADTTSHAKTAGKAATTRAGTGDVALPEGSHLVDEGGLTFEVNFVARHDCGIFLDHRDTRAWLRELAKSYGPTCRFLNLFCYTGTATVYAADGGCTHSVSVDMSSPSLEWARRNMTRNGFDTGHHRFVRADALRWVVDERHGPNRYDLVFCDVPTFSNSSRMGRRSFDVQRDHVELLISVSRLLARGNGDDDGLCLFSCNLRGFKPNVDALARAGVAIEDVTARTVPEDFARNPKVHHCFLARRT